MHNEDVETAWNYHDRTKHSYESVRRSAHFLDWSNQPLPFKIYRDVEPIRLEQPAPVTGASALSAIAVEFPPASGTLTLEDLTRLLYYAAGITRRRTYAGGAILFRAAACTGALYEIELYVVCSDLPGLEAGVYHFGPADLALRRLREGDFRALLARASGHYTPIVHAPAIVIATGTYWRNAWKYQARTYRHFGWDNGTLHANLLAVAAALQLPSDLACGFVDADVNRLLGLDTDREVALTMVAVGRGQLSPPDHPETAPLQLDTEPLSREEVDYPLMREMHEASSLETPDQVAAWRASNPAERPASREKIALQPLTDDEMPRDTIEEVILRRGSSRQFRHDSITFAQLSTILDRATRPLHLDFRPPQQALNNVYLIVNAVEGLTPGAYYYDADARALELLKRGDFRRQAAYLALEQDLAGDAAAAVFFLADLHAVLRRLGNRGYRAVQLEAGILGGKMYLAAYAHRLGATGLTFYDDDVVSFFSPHAAGESTIFLVALGHPAARR